jgi:leucyl aminopeptidase
MAPADQADRLYRGILSTVPVSPIFEGNIMKYTRITLSITAALFLGEFVPRTVPWVHCDMTGPAWSGNASIDGATGFGARTLLELLTHA